MILLIIIRLERRSSARYCFARRLGLPLRSRVNCSLEQTKTNIKIKAHFGYGVNIHLHIVNDVLVKSCRRSWTDIARYIVALLGVKEY